MSRDSSTTPAIPKIWFTALETIQTPRGARYQGVSYAGTRGPRRRRHGDQLPNGADVRYRSPLRIHPNEAFELARSRTVHHNVWHDGTAEAARIASMHHAVDCHEARS